MAAFWHDQHKTAGPRHKNGVPAPLCNVRALSQAHSEDRCPHELSPRLEAQAREGSMTTRVADQESGNISSNPHLTSDGG